MTNPVRRVTVDLRWAGIDAGHDRDPVPGERRRLRGAPPGAPAGRKVVRASEATVSTDGGGSEFVVLYQGLMGVGDAVATGQPQEPFLPGRVLRYRDGLPVDPEGSPHLR